MEKESLQTSMHRQVMFLSIICQFLNNKAAANKSMQKRSLTIKHQLCATISSSSGWTFIIQL